MQSSLFGEVKLSDDPFLLEGIIDDHNRLRAIAGARLRARLADEREARAKIRREAHLNVELQRRYLQIVRSKASFVTGKAQDDLLSWKHLEEPGDVDARAKHFRSTDAVEVTEVTKWAKQQQQLRAGSRSPDRTASPLNTPGRGNEPFAAGAAQSTTERKHKQLSPESKSAKRRKEKAATRASRTSVPHLPSLPTVQLTQKAVLQAESDFSLLTCGDTHAPLKLFTENGPDFYTEVGVPTRKAFNFEFLDYMNARNLTEISFADFIEIVHGPQDDINNAIVRWAPHFA